jgi:hypothetical protein
MSSTTTFDPAQLETLANDASGSVLLPGDDGYEAARRVHNGMIDRRPALIVRCRSAADAAAAVRFARASGAEISIRGGGHNVGGLAVADGAVMVDLAEMKKVSVDPDARLVAAQGGLTWGELNDAVAEHGLAVTGGAVSTTGIAGFTLGGGLGWIMSKYGLAADNLVAAEDEHDPHGHCADDRLRPRRGLGSLRFRREVTGDRETDDEDQRRPDQPTRGTCPTRVIREDVGHIEPHQVDERVRHVGSRLLGWFRASRRGPARRFP